VATLDERLTGALAAGALRPLDLYFGRWMRALADRPSDALVLAACLASQRVGAGGVCLDLEAAAGRAHLPETGEAVVAPALETWREALLASGMVGRPGELAPLVLDDRHRLYLARYWHLEQDLAGRLAARARRETPAVDRAALRAGLARLFPGTEGAGPDWQRVAGAVAALRTLTVVSGGPGTGKTHTVTAILALLAGQAPGGRLRAALAAPTGKAAARLAEAVRRARDMLALEPRERAAIPDEARTLHRLLGAMPGRVGFRHHPGNPLHLDALVVDEASMVDLALMSRLVAALPEHARLILLGDRDQLASVEAGAVLGDLCGQGHPVGWSPGLGAAVAELTGYHLAAAGPGGPAIADSIVLLRRSYRFGAESGIGRLAARVNAGDGEGALALLDAGAWPDIALRTLPASGREAALAATVLPALRAMLASAGPEEALEHLGRVRVLGAVRAGPWGVVELNRLVERALTREGLIEPGRGYRGRPVLVTRNDYTLGLFNGDVGILWPDPEAGGALRAWFRRPEGGLRRVLPSRLPGPETVYAMTVHRGQGSEFDRVLLVLPELPRPHLTRELVYTGLTRARQGVEIWCERRVLLAAVRTRVERSSGLRDALWGPAAPALRGWAEGQCPMPFADESAPTSGPKTSTPNTG
jgi:exodeoxyribonuclease V alpha subunit